MKSRLEEARLLLQSARYTEAAAILRTIDHPTAREWLQRISKKTTIDAADSPVGLGAEPPVSERPPFPRRETEIIVTTTDLPYRYDVISPVYFQVSNKGVFSSPFSKLQNHYKDELNKLRQSGQISKQGMDWGFLWYGEFSVGQNSFESAFYIAVREIQKRAQGMGAHAVVGMRQDIDLDTNGFQFFYLQMYGTAVRFY